MDNKIAVIGAIVLVIAFFFVGMLLGKGITGNVTESEEFQSLQDENDKLSQDLSSYKSFNVDLTARNKALETENNNLKNDVEDVPEVDICDKLEDEADEIENDIEDLEDDIADLEDDLATETDQDEKDDIQDEIDDKEDEIADLEDDLSDNEDDQDDEDC